MKQLAGADPCEPARAENEAKPKPTCGKTTSRGAQGAGVASLRPGTADLDPDHTTLQNPVILSF